MTESPTIPSTSPASRAPSSAAAPASACTTGSRRLFRDCCPTLEITLGGQPLDPRTLFPDADAHRSSRSAMAAASIWRSQARQHPDTGYHRLRGVFRRHRQAGAGHRRATDLRNIRLFTDDALKLLRQAARRLARRGLPALSRPLAEDAPPQAPLRLADDAGRTGAGAQARARCSTSPPTSRTMPTGRWPTSCARPSSASRRSSRAAGTSPIPAGSRPATSRRRAAKAA